MVSGGPGKQTSRSLAPTQPELSKKSFADLNREAEARLRGMGISSTPVHNQPNMWSRLPGQACRVPNKQLLHLRTTRHGCSALQFAHHGRLLAGGCEKDGLFGVVLFEIPSGQQRGQLVGHHSIVYDMSWANDDSYVATASSDGTVRCWVISGLVGGEMHVLAHPCFVYCLNHHPTSDSLLITGGYDKLLRVWSVNPTDQSLVREMEGHSGFVNSICFDAKGSSMFSADSKGVVLVWSCPTSDPGSVAEWNITREINDPAIKGTPVNHITLHPSGRRLLLHTRDSCLRMLDLRINSCVHQYFGASNRRERLHGCLSTCGNFIFAGSEDGQVFVWNTDTGQLVATYSDLPFKLPVTCAVFHPHDHIVAFSAFGDNQPIIVYKFDRSALSIDRQTASSPPNEKPVKQHNEIQRMQSTDSISSFQTTNKAAPGKDERRLSVILEAPTPDSSRQREQVKTAGENSAENTQRPSFATAANETLKLMRIADKLDSVLKSTKTRRSADSSIDIMARSGRFPQNEAKLSSRPAQDSLSRLSSSFQPGLTASLHHPHMSRDSIGSQMSWATMWDMSPLPQGNATPLTSTLTSVHKPTFTFQPPTPSTSVSSDINQVIALYDYDANRADEISFRRGDIISVLYRENDNWWMGETRDKQQGYFPANYVVEHDQRAILAGSPTAEEDLRLSETALIGAPSERPLSPMRWDHANGEDQMGSNMASSVVESVMSATDGQKSRHRRRRAKPNH